MASLLYRKDRFVTVHNQNVRKSHHRPQCCLQFLCCTSELNLLFFRRAAGSKKVSEQFVLCIHLSFVNFALHATPTNKILTHQGKGGGVNSAHQIHKAKSR